MITLPRPDADLVMVLAAIRSIGGRPMLVGGCVRDTLLGLPVKDIDVEVYGVNDPDRLAAAPDIGPVEARFLTLDCNGCGAKAELDFDNPELPDGWAASEAGDFCPRCQVLN